MSIWMKRCRSVTDLTSSDATATRESRWWARKLRSAVEKARAWKPAKTKSRFPPLPTLPWKSRQVREIPTFPPRRRLLPSPRPRPKPTQRPNPKPRWRPDGRITLFHKPDRTPVNQTGHLDLLTTAAACSKTRCETHGRDPHDTDRLDSDHKWRCALR